MNSHSIPEFRKWANNSQVRNSDFSASSGTEDWTLTQCMKALIRRKRLLGGIAGAGLMIAALVSVFQPRSYRSQASLEFQGVNENFLDMRDIYPNTSPGADDTYLQTQSEILQEDSLVEQVVGKLGLQADPEFRGRSARPRRGASDPQSQTNVRSVTQAVKKNLEVTFTRGSRVIRITAESRDPQMAADLANTLASVFIEQNIKHRQQAARQTYAALDTQLSDIRSRLDRAERRAKASPEAAAGLRTEVAADRRFYEAAAERADQAALASVIPISNIRLISPAQPAGRPFKPNVPLNFAIGLAAGLLLGAGWVLLREQTNSGLRAPGDAGLYLPVPELGAIPEAAGQSPRLARFRSTEGNAPVERATLEQRFSPVSEAFRATLASILSAPAADGPSRVLVVTSSQPMEGKTTVVANLGLALAEISDRVLLIDGDMRRPRLHKVFGIANSWGLSDVLRETNAIEELPVDALVRKTSIPHLSLLPSGASADNVFSLLYSGRLERLLPKFREEFDYVLVDSPPSLEFADARIMARYAEQLLLVVRADYTGRHTAQAAVRRLLLDGIPVMGVILNRWNPAYSEDYAYVYQNALASQEAR